MDIKRTVLWVVFSMSLLILWDNWQRANGKSSMFFPNPTQVAKPASGSGATRAKGEVPQASIPGASAAAVAAPPVTATTGVTPVQHELVTVTTDIFKADIDTIGGELKRLELLKHKDGIDQTKNLVLFENSSKRTYLGQSGLIGGAFPNHKSGFVVKPGPRILGDANQLQLVLESMQDGVKLTKTYTFKRGDYLIDVKHEVSNNTGAAITPSVYVQLVRDGNKPEGESQFYSTFTGPAIYNETEHFKKIEFKDIDSDTKKVAESKGTKKSEFLINGDNGWVALVQHYFVSAFVPPAKAAREMFAKPVGDNLYAVGAILPLGTVAPGASTSMSTPLYAGPQESAVLESLAPGLDLVKDYGWLTIVAKPIFWLMTQIHKYLGNWGWTIIVLTIIIKLAFFPLSAASYRSMAKMKVVTPKMTAIRERHKGDPQKMNQAMMELYKTEKINPLGGCLPIVVQIPVFIALYWVLLASVEMRNAPWIGWIHDLASPDPFYILPVIMAVSMFIQTKLNPPPPDPIQAKVMMFMPIIFSVMFFFFPAGLVLYWVVNNVLSIAQQWVITKKMEAGKTA
ncbi:membrane protein insertase YidC [soil metagenome]